MCFIVITVRSVFLNTRFPSHYAITSNELQSLYLSTKCALERKWSWTHAALNEQSSLPVGASLQCRVVTALHRWHVEPALSWHVTYRWTLLESGDLEWQARCCFSFPNHSWFNLIGVDKKCDRCNDFFLFSLFIAFMNLF